MLLASQITWSENCDNALAKIDAGGDLSLMQDVLLQVKILLVKSEQSISTFMNDTSTNFKDLKLINLKPHIETQ